MMPRIRATTATDVTALVDLMTVFYAEASYSLPQTPATRALTALLAEPQWGAIWLAEDAAMSVGYVVLTLGYSIEYGGLRGFIDDLYVLPSVRGRGIGAALVAAVRSDCAERGVRALNVEVGRRITLHVGSTSGLAT